MIARQCKVPSCGNSSTEGAYCDEHQRFKPEPWSRKRERLQFYGTARWQKFRLAVLREDPICVRCNRAPANEVHHIKRAREFPELRFSRENVEALCPECHATETARESQEGRG